MAECASLLLCIRKHFGDIDPVRATRLAQEADYDIVQVCLRLRWTRLRGGAGRASHTDEYSKRSPATVLRRRLSAIQRADYPAYKKAALESTEAIREIRREAIEELHVSQDACQARHHLFAQGVQDVFDDKDAQRLEASVLGKAIELAGAGRRQAHTHQDDACAEIIYLWAQCAGKTPREPGSYRKTPLDETGTVTAFLRDVLYIYADAGLGSHLFPGTSGSAWSRIFSRYREQWL